MTLPRRRIVRPAPMAAMNTRRLDQIRERLAKDRAALARWMSRLKRAFRTVERLQASIARLDKQLKSIEGG